MGTSANFTTIATGPWRSNGTLGTFAADLLPNNPYTLRLTASNGQSVNTTVAVVVNTGATKLGDFTLTYQDIRFLASVSPSAFAASTTARTRIKATSVMAGHWVIALSNITTDANLMCSSHCPMASARHLLSPAGSSFFGCT